MDNQFFSSLEYIFIFDYYDSPLFFISQSSENNRYYLFYSIDDDAYFFSELSASDINYLFMNPNGYDILHYLKDKSKLKFVLISKKSFNTKSLSEYTGIFDEDIYEAFPLERFPIEYEYVHKVNFNEIQKKYKSYFPNLFDNDQLTLRIKDKKNSHSLNIDIVYSALNFMKNTWQDLNSRYTDWGPEKKLLMTAPSKGSLKLEFELANDEQTALFSDEASFSELIDFVDNLMYTPMYDDEELINERKIIEETVKLYEKNDLSIDFISNDVKLSNISKSSNIKKNLDVLKARVNDKIIENSTLTEDIEVSGEVLAANKSKNYFKIKSLALGDIGGVFEKELFKKIKNSEKQITVSKNITACITKQQITNIDTNEIKTKYVMTSFDQ